MIPQPFWCMFMCTCSCAHKAKLCVMTTSVYAPLVELHLVCCCNNICVCYWMLNDVWNLLKMIKICFKLVGLGPSRKREHLNISGATEMEILIYVRCNRNARAKRGKRDTQDMWSYDLRSNAATLKSVVEIFLKGKTQHPHGLFLISFLLLGNIHRRGSRTRSTLKIA